MKKISLSLPIANLLIAMAVCMTAIVSCDKIEPSDDGTYTIYSGAIGQWEDAASLSDHSQRVWIEKYTGPRCPNCPDADVVINGILEQPQYKNVVIATGIHATAVFGTPYAGNPDFRTDEGETWYTSFLGSSTGLPAAMLNRQRIGSTFDVFTPTAAFNDRIDAILNNDAQVALAIESHFDNQANKVSTTATVEILSEINDDLTLTVLVMEDSLIAAQQMPSHAIDSNHVHNHILRGLITDKWGIDVDASHGSARKVTLRSDLPDGCLMQNCHIVAFVSDKSTRFIYNVAACHIAQ